MYSTATRCELDSHGAPLRNQLPTLSYKWQAEDRSATIGQHRSLALCKSERYTAGNNLKHPKA